MAAGRVTRSPLWLTVLYDPGCAVCRRCRHWLEFQPTYVPLVFLAADDPVARDMFGVLPWLGNELIVSDDLGRCWIGPAAFLMCLWATRDWREWSYRLSGPALVPLAERFFHLVSANRKRLSAVVGEPECDGGACRHRRRMSRR